MISRLQCLRFFSQFLLKQVPAVSSEPSSALLQHRFPRGDLCTFLLVLNGYQCISLGAVNFSPPTRTQQRQEGEQGGQAGARRSGRIRPHTAAFEVLCPPVLEENHPSGKVFLSPRAEENFPNFL